MMARRKERFQNWLEDRLAESVDDILAIENWLAEDTEVITVKHDMFPNLIYKRYLTSDAYAQNRSKIERLRAQQKEIWEQFGVK